jgi:hypothetical protein
MMESKKIKSRAGVDLGLALALSALLPSLDNGYQIALIVVMAILVAAGLILLCHNRFSTALWRRLVKIANDIDIGYTAIAFGLYGPGLVFLQHQWWLPGVSFLLAGAFLNGWGIMQPIAPLFKRSRS